MYQENFILVPNLSVEEGIVIEKLKGSAKIVLNNNIDCHECGAKLFCSPSNQNERILIVKDNFGVLPGDKVKIAIEEKNVLKASIFLYGIPLLILILGILFGTNLFHNSTELKSSLLAVGLVFIYFVLFLAISKITNKKERNLPRIISISYHKSL
ncbi:MAG: hypothetical protein STSR0008_02960 [Ignavibacterium sp.]